MWQFWINLWLFFIRNERSRSDAITIIVLFQYSFQKQFTAKNLLNKGKTSDLKHTINMSFVELTWAIWYYILQYWTEAFVSNTKEKVTQRIKPRFLMRCTAENSNEGGSYQEVFHYESNLQQAVQREIMESVCLGNFNTQLDKALRNLVWISIVPVSNGEKSLQLHSKSCIFVIGKDTQIRKHTEHLPVSHGAVQLIM